MEINPANVTLTGIPTLYHFNQDICGQKAKNVFLAHKTNILLHKNAYMQINLQVDTILNEFIQYKSKEINELFQMQI